jgi:hypothetical protein
MNNVRLLLWFSLLFVVWLNVDAWMQDYATLRRHPPPLPARPRRR